MSNINPENQQYNDEMLLLDGLLEFQPEFFEQLTQDELTVLRRYYLTGAKEIPHNMFSYRAEILKEDPSLQEKAQAVYQKIRQIAGMNS